MLISNQGLWLRALVGTAVAAAVGMVGAVVVADRVLVVAVVVLVVADKAHVLLAADRLQAASGIRTRKNK